jgi:hypothetical protein
MGWKEEVIKKHGIAGYAKKLAQMREWKKTHPSKIKIHQDNWRRKHNLKGGSHYEKTLRYKQTGIQGERERIRKRHQHRWRRYKNIIAPDSQLHHEWLPREKGYTGVALVEANQHMHGFIDVIKILKGTITLFTEREVRER